MGWFDTVSGWFGGAEEYDPYTDIYISPTPEPSPLEFFPSVPEADYEYYDPSYGITTGPGVEAEPWYGSLWGAFKEAGTQLIKSPLLPALLKRDKGNLQWQFPRAPDAPYDRMDGQLYTPYRRKDTGSIPAPIIRAPGGISPMILLIGAGAVFFLMMQKKKGK